MKISMYQVDAFSNQLFGGNPAAICPLEKWLDTSTMQAIAAENNLSETAFFVPNANSSYNLKWFTPTTEVDLCGHATLAAAHVIFNHLNYDKDIISFHSNSGLLTVNKNGNLLTLNFPSNSPTPSQVTPKLIAALGKAPIAAYNSIYQMAIYESQEDILQLKPNFILLEEIDCIIVTAPSKKAGIDFVSRFFAPGKGINEDPVTGSAHTVLAPFWAEKLDKKQLHALQISERGGELWCEILEGNRVAISGRAVTYLEGIIHIS